MLVDNGNYSYTISTVPNTSTSNFATSVQSCLADICEIQIVWNDVLNRWELQLNNDKAARQTIEQQYLINFKRIKKDGGYIVMDNNETVSISKDKKKSFLPLFKTLGK